MQLAALAEKNGVALSFEASVAGGIPIVKTLREGLAGNSIERVYGILNGTCNYILTPHGDGGALASRIASPRRKSSAMRKPIPPSTSAASTPRTSSPS